MEVLLVYFSLLERQFLVVCCSCTSSLLKVTSVNQCLCVLFCFCFFCIKALNGIEKYRTHSNGALSTFIKCILFATLLVFLQIWIYTDVFDFEVANSDTSYWNLLTREYATMFVQSVFVGKLFPFILFIIAHIIFMIKRQVNIGYFRVANYRTGFGARGSFETVIAFYMYALFMGAFTPLVFLCVLLFLIVDSLFVKYFIVFESKRSKQTTSHDYMLDGVIVTLSVIPIILCGCFIYMIYYYRYALFLTIDFQVVIYIMTAVILIGTVITIIIIIVLRIKKPVAGNSNSTTSDAASTTIEPFRPWYFKYYDLVYNLPEQYKEMELKEMQYLQQHQQQQQMQGMMMTMPQVFIPPQQYNPNNPQQQQQPLMVQQNPLMQNYQMQPPPPSMQPIPMQQPPIMQPQQQYQQPQIQQQPLYQPQQYQAPPQMYYNQPPMMQHPVYVQYPQAQTYPMQGYSQQVQYQQVVPQMMPPQAQQLQQPLPVQSVIPPVQHNPSMNQIPVQQPPPPSIQQQPQVIPQQQNNSQQVAPPSVSNIPEPVPSVQQQQDSNQAAVPNETQ